MQASFLLEMSIYTHLYDNKKVPTSQEYCGRVTKKVPKGLNCYQIRGTRRGDVDENQHFTRRIDCDKRWLCHGKRDWMDLEFFIT
jgi:hypothetical protein